MNIGGGGMKIGKNGDRNLWKTPNVAGGNCERTGTNYVNDQSSPGFAIKS